MYAFCSPIPRSRQVRYEHSISLPFWGFGTSQELLEQVLCLLLLLFPGCSHFRSATGFQSIHPTFRRASCPSLPVQEPSERIMLLFTHDCSNKILYTPFSQWVSGVLTP